MKDEQDKEIRRVEGMSHTVCGKNDLIFPNLMNLGRIVQNATCTPSMMDATYRRLKGTSFQKAAKSDRKVKYVAETEVTRTRFMYVFDS